MSAAIFSANASVTWVNFFEFPWLGYLRISQENLQMVAVGCPGGSSGNEDASTTLSPCTPITLARESTTDFGLLLLPIAPNPQSFSDDCTQGQG